MPPPTPSPYKGREKIKPFDLSPPIQDFDLLQIHPAHRREHKSLEWVLVSTSSIASAIIPCSSIT